MSHYFTILAFIGAISRTFRARARAARLRDQRYSDASRAPWRKLYYIWVTPQQREIIITHSLAISRVNSSSTYVCMNAAAALLLLLLSLGVLLIIMKEAPLTPSATHTRRRPFAFQLPPSMPSMTTLSDFTSSSQASGFALTQSSSALSEEGVDKFN